ncbi:hypothetical protein EVAR_32037_1 [Eumeta japonica]|uniref:Uncharacterized protein n=1 Tax=Eumeta variegata TaxID=151549 RepID=A0A4C1WMH4_EUMVA|nr:hypothetical protein EVAR_32037_1 [Eumeta japonica]
MTVSNDITQEQEEHNNEATLQNVIINDCPPANNEQALPPLEKSHEEPEDDVLKEQVNAVVNNENGLDMNDNLHEPNLRQESKVYQSLDNSMQNFNNGVTPTENHNLPNGSMPYKSESYVDQPPNIIYTGLNTIEIDGQVISMDEDMPHIDPFLTIKPNDVDEQAIINAQIASDIYNEMAAPTWQSLITKDNYNVEYDDTSQLKADILSIIQYSEY